MASQIAHWFSPYEQFVAIGLGAAMIVAIAAIACRMIRSAAGQAAIWRIATVSMLLLLALELTGFGRAIEQLGRQWIARRVETREAEVVAERVPDATPPIRAESESSSAVLVVPPSDETKDFRLKPTLRTPTAAESVGVPPLGGMDHERRLKPELQPPPPSQANWPVAIWLAGTAATFCLTIGGRIAAGRFRRRCCVMNDNDLDERLAGLRATFAIKRSVILLSSPRTTSPVVFGGRRPALVLPANFMQDFDRRQQDAILAHELAHLAAHDAGWQAASRILCALLWWHPLVWWSRRKLRAAHEALADEGSLIVPDGPRVLAEALVALGQRLARPQPRFGLSLGGGQFRSGLGRRVERLLSLPQRPWKAPRRARMALVHFSLPALVALAAAFIGTAWAPSQASFTQGETTMNVFTTTWRGSLLVTALCAMLGNTPSPVAAGDEPTTPPATSDHDRAIHEKFRAIRERAAALDEQGKHDEADRLRREGKEMMSKSGISPDDPHGFFVTPGNSEQDDEQDKTPGRQKDIERKVHELELEGKHDQAEQLKKQGKELYERYSKLNAAGPHTPTVARPSPERQKLYESYRALQGKIDAAKKDGNDEQVHQLMQEVEVLRARLRATEATIISQRASRGGDREARLKHLSAAAENLKAAGCDAEATHVLQLIDRIRAGSPDSASGLANAVDFPVTTSRRVQIDGGPRQEANALSAPRRYRVETIVSQGDRYAVTDGAYGNAASGASSQDVQELRSQIEQMRREMRQMREDLDRAKSSGPPKNDPFGR